MDSRVVGHNSGLILGINDHICSDSSLHAHHSMHCECVVKHAWPWYLPAVIKHDQSPQAGAVLLDSSPYQGQIQGGGGAGGGGPCPPFRTEQALNAEVYRMFSTCSYSNTAHISHHI